MTGVACMCCWYWGSKSKNVQPRRIDAATVSAVPLVVTVFAVVTVNSASSARSGMFQASMVPHDGVASTPDPRSPVARSITRSTDLAFVCCTTSRETELQHHPSPP